MNEYNAESFVHKFRDIGQDCRVRKCRWFFVHELEAMIDLDESRYLSSSRRNINKINVVIFI